MSSEEHRAKKTKTAPTPDLPFPDINLAASSDLMSRLNAFLPQLQAANSELDPMESNMEDVGSDDEAYIEMDLGLGVLKQLREGDMSESDSDSDSEAELEPIREGAPLADLLASAKRHGKGPRGRPDPAEVAENASTPTPYNGPLNTEQDPLLSLIHSSKRHGKGSRGTPDIEEVKANEITPTPHHNAKADAARKKKEDNLLEAVLMNSKRHGKGVKGVPLIEEVEGTSHTPTPDEQEAKERRRRSLGQTHD